MKRYFHICSDGRITRRFIVSETDYYAAFNTIGVSAAASGFTVLAFSIEDSHPHILGYGSLEECLLFSNCYQITYFRHIVTSRGGADGVVFRMEVFPIDNADYLRNAGTYVICQPTKDGKAVMPFDYKWGTGSMYFRDENHIPIWYFDKKRGIVHPVKLESISAREQARILHSKKKVPQDWLVCQGILLPESYVDVKHFERIYRTHNCYRAFLASGRNKDNEILQEMAKSRGIRLDDNEAMIICRIECQNSFGVSDTKNLSGEQRLALAKQLRSNHNLSVRQLATLVRLPEEEIFRYIR
ncbi:MAG: hypothetical protein IKX45_05575 [Bacteroidales bacterium]|nr:hypothetical protein [Bacteroidales bacterium]MBR5703703.1 hypothetical protein [Bacteroidales bacterium]